MMFKKPAVTSAPATDNGSAETEQHLDGNALAARALEFGAKVGEASEDAISIVMKAKEDWQGGPFRVLIGMQTDFTEEDLDQFPIPDTDTGNNPDEFKVEKTDAKGKTKLVNSNFYVNFGDGTPSGQHILSQIEFVERAGNPNMVKDDIPQEIMELTPNERETRLAFLKGRRNTIRVSYKKAMALYFQFKAVNNYPGIQAEPIWVKGKEGEEVENTTKPIAVWTIPEEGKPIAKWESLSIGAFMKLNPKRGLELGGTFRNLIDSGATKKTPGSGSNTDNNDGFVIKTSERLLSVLAEEHGFVDEMLNDKAQVEYGKLLKAMNAKDNDEMIVAVVEFNNFLTKLIADTGAGDKYVRLQTGGSELVAKTTKQAA